MPQVARATAAIPHEEEVPVRYRPISSLVLVALAALTLGDVVRAQTLLPVTPDPALCTMTPLRPEDMVAAASSPVASPEATPSAG
jgi:hypothetical protein